MMSSHKELDKFLDKSAGIFSLALQNIVRAYYGLGLSIPEARKELAEKIRETNILADLNGRKRLWMEYDYAKDRGGKFADLPDSTPIMPNLTFDEAVKDLITREPRLAKSAAEVSRLYSMDHVFAMARSAEKIITERAQKAIEEFLVNNTPADALSKTIQEIGNFSEAYAGTVYQTNISTSYNNARIAQAKDPEISDVIVGLRYEGIDDARTRDNHRAGFGTMAPQDHPIWKTHSPPNGYRCRCALEFVSIFDAERMGLWDGKEMKPHLVGGTSFHADPGFKNG